MSLPATLLLPVDGRRTAALGLGRDFLDGLHKVSEYRRTTGVAGITALYRESEVTGDLWDAVRKCVEMIPGCRLIEGMPDLKTVFRTAGTDAAVVWRAESGIPPKETELVWDALKNGAPQAVVGSRFVKGAIHRRSPDARGYVLEERFAAWAFARAAGAELRDPMAGLWALKAVWLEGLPDAAIASGLPACAAAAARKGRAAGNTRDVGARPPGRIPARPELE